VAALGGCSEDISVLDGPDAAADDATGPGAAGPGGSGGAASSGPSSGGAGGAGAGGGSSPCESFVMAGPPVLVEPPNVGDQDAPVLALSSDDADTATVAFRHAPYLDLYPDEVAYASFPPWGTWPTAAVGPSAHAISGLPQSFAISQSPGDSFNLLSAPGDASVAGAWFVPRVAPPKASLGATMVSSAATRAAFVASKGTRHLLGHEGASAGGSSILAGVAASDPEGGGVVTLNVFLGCASGGPMPAAAVPSGDGWLVAFANGASSPGCLDPELPGPPHAIHVVHLLDNGDYSTGAMLAQGGPIAQIAMAPRSDGAWIIWQRASGGQIAPIEAVRLDVAGEVVLGPIDVAPSASEPVSFAVDRLGDELAIAYEFAGLNARAPGIVAGRVRDDGVLVAAGSLDGPILTGPPSVIGAPSGDRILVAFGVLGDHPEVGLVRFDCAANP
jgi:hypothetical protein